MLLRECIGSVIVGIAAGGLLLAAIAFGAVAGASNVAFTAATVQHTAEHSRLELQGPFGVSRSTLLGAGPSKPLQRAALSREPVRGGGIEGEASRAFGVPLIQVFLVTPARTCGNGCDVDDGSRDSTPRPGYIRNGDCRLTLPAASHAVHALGRSWTAAGNARAECDLSMHGRSLSRASHATC